MCAFCTSMYYGNYAPTYLGKYLSRYLPRYVFTQPQPQPRFVCRGDAGTRVPSFRIGGKLSHMPSVQARPDTLGACPPLQTRGKMRPSYLPWQLGPGHQPMGVDGVAMCHRGACAIPGKSLFRSVAPRTPPDSQRFQVLSCWVCWFEYIGHQLKRRLRAARKVS